MNANTLLVSTQVLLIILFIVVMALFVKGLVSRPAKPDDGKRRRGEAVAHGSHADAVDDAHRD